METTQREHELLDLLAHQDECLIAITDGKELPRKSLRSLPPWRAVMVARVAREAHLMSKKEVEELVEEARVVGRWGKLEI